jgi:hypothetical protein
MSRPKLGGLVYVRHFVPGNPVGVGTDTRLVVAEFTGPKRKPTRARVVLDDGRQGSWWVDCESLRLPGEE